MRAEEGDETVGDYAREGKQTHDRIKETQRAGSPLGRVVHVDRQALSRRRRIPRWQRLIGGRLTIL